MQFESTLNVSKPKVAILFQLMLVQEMEEKGKGLHVQKR